MKFRILSLILIHYALFTIHHSAAAKQPNIIYILLDEWGYFEWSKMGHPILDTPNIDQLASEGMRFTQFLAGANVCAPTRSTLMTGQHTGQPSPSLQGQGLDLVPGLDGLPTEKPRRGRSTAV